MKRILASVALMALIAPSCATMPASEITDIRGCFAVGGLNTAERDQLRVGRGNPILAAGGQQFVCGCFLESKLAGMGENASLLGAEEAARMAGAEETGRIVGAGEKGSLAGVGEAGAIGGDAEQSKIAGAFEQANVSGAGEKGQLGGAGEAGRVAGAGEAGSLAGASERWRLRGAMASLSCREVEGCSGYQLIGFEPPTINMLTRDGPKPVPASCIAW